MRGRGATVAGLLLVAAYAAVAIWVTATTGSDAPLDRSALDERRAPAERFIEAWERSRTATFLTRGTFERRSDVTGAAIASEDVVAQRPPQRLHRQLGGVDGRHDDRIVVCPAALPDQEEDPPCHLGEPGGTTYEESVERELEGLRTLLLGEDPLYEVAVDGDGCFELDQRRADPRAPFGVAARFCFDERTGAPIRTEVSYEGGVREQVVVEDVTTEVTDEDLEP